ncbi:MAG: SDR family oxidoreductase [Trueperaceae bacterium]|nr:MAG: SDR family oxidoreductase [Trueperaceae bacterium]
MDNDLKMSLDGMVVVVSGASHGLGKSIAQQLATFGADLVLLARDRGRLEQVADELSGARGEILLLPCDVSVSEQVASAAERIRAWRGKVDVLVNNAGIPAPRTMEETTFEDWNSVLGVNLSGVFYLTRGLWDQLKAGGAGYVITVSGTAGLRGGGSPAYGATKFGLTGLTRSFAVAGAEHGIRVTTLYPGSMDTGWRGSQIGVTPRSESMDPDEVARYVAYLVRTPKEFVVNEAILNPSSAPWQ